MIFFCDQTKTSPDVFQVDAAKSHFLNQFYKTIN